MLIIATGSGVYAQDTTDTLTNDEEEPFQFKVPVKYQAYDSIRFDYNLRIVYLYGKAQVDYEGINLKAHYVEIDLAKNEITARGKPDSTGKITEKVIFTDESGENKASEIRYNYKTKKGKIADAFSQQGEAYVHMGDAKKHPNDEIHLKNGKFTTCDKEEPHYHFRLTKAIVIPDDKIVTGPLYMVIGKKIPTPLALPFGYFPNSKRETKGIIIPQFGKSATYGFFLLNGGYYQPIGKYMDIQLLGDIYSRGSWALKQVTRYKKRYRFDGNFNTSYSVFKQGDKEFPDFAQSNEFFVRWNHNQDPKSRPGHRFGANVNFGSQNNFQNNFTTDAQNYLSSSFQSNISYMRSWVGKPYSLGLNMRHNQNRLSRIVNLTVPEVTFNVNRFFPFENKKRIGQKKFHENIGISYSFNGRNDITGHDSLFSLNRVDDLFPKMRNGVRHTATLNAPVKFFNQKFTANFGSSLSERWYIQYLNKAWNGSEVVTDTVRGFIRASEASLNGSVTTKIYGMYSGRKSSAPKLRHVLTPSVNASYRPDQGLQRAYQSDSAGTQATYSPMDLGIFGKPATGASGTVGFSIINSLELKRRSSKDTISGWVKHMLIENFQVAANYDLMRDSLNWSNIVISGRTTLFKSFGIVYTGVIDPYRYNNGKITNELMVADGSGLGRVIDNNLALTLTLKGKSRAKKKKKTNDEDEDDRPTGNYVDFNTPYNVNVAYNLRFNRSFYGTTDSMAITQAATMNADVNLVKWLKLGVTTGYDFVAEELTYTEFNLYVDLHCWELRFNTIPFGIRKSFLVTLNVKASILSDLKLQHRRSWVDI
ncbi:MAG: putative LPS assembly protein LptD [Flavobacteriales bacterium]